MALEHQAKGTLGERPEGLVERLRWRFDALTRELQLCKRVCGKRELLVAGIQVFFCLSSCS